MKTVELRDLDDAKLYVLHGLWFQRALPPTAATVKPALEWALEIASNGNPLPPVGFISDIGHVAFGAERTGRDRELVVLPGVNPGLLRTYEDHVLGKFYADWTFERAGDALRRYQGRDRARGLAFVLQQFHERAKFDSVVLGPAVIRSLLELSPDEVLARGWETLHREGPMPLLLSLMEALIGAARRTAEVLANEDLFELEHGTALAELGQRIALRQVLKMADHFEHALPQHKVRPLAGRQEVPTRVLDEDTYPVGGYSSIATRGSIESLLHSQLAYMDPAERVDLFTVKYVRDELFFYARDENQFLRRRRAFVFALYPDLVRSRFKDADLPCQRIILVLGLLVAGIRKLTDWLNTDALTFEIRFITSPHGDLAQERDLLRMVLREDIANGTVTLDQLAADQLTSHCANLARKTLCHLLTIAPSEQRVEPTDTVVSRLVIDSACPAVGIGDPAALFLEADGPLESWAAVLERLLQIWV